MRARRGHDGSVRRAGTLIAASLAALLIAASYAAVDGAAAPSCASKVTVSGPKDRNLILTPSVAKFQLGSCLAFANATSAPVNIAITKDGATVFTATLTAGATTAVKASYTPKTAGHASIAASSHVLVLKFTGSGSVTVSPAPSDSPSSGGSATPHGHQSSTPRGRPSKSAHPSKSSKSHSPKPHATGFKLPPLPPLPTVGQSALPRGSSPVVAPGLGSPAPLTTTSSSPVAAVVAGPLETAEDTSRGLPIAVAVLVILGLASGYGRVLLATPRPAETPAGRAGGKHRATRADRAATKRGPRKRGNRAVDKHRNGDHRA